MLVGLLTVMLVSLESECGTKTGVWLPSIFLLHLATFSSKMVFLLQSWQLPLEASVCGAKAMKGDLKQTHIIIGLGKVLNCGTLALCRKIKILNPFMYHKANTSARAKFDLSI